MSANNGVHLLGRLTADPELKTTASGVSVCQFSVAVPRSYAKKGEERQTDFFTCVAWRGSAEFVCQYFAKGDQIGISGELQSRTYEDKDGNRRKAVEIVVSGVCFAGEKKKPSSADHREDDFAELSDEDLPF